MVASFQRDVKTSLGSTAARIAIMEGRQDKAVEHLDSATPGRVGCSDIGRPALIGPDLPPLDLRPCHRWLWGPRRSHPIEPA